MSQAFINFLPGPTLPSVFNPSTFKSTTVKTDAVNTDQLVVNSKSTTNGIDDFGTIDAEVLIVQSSANFHGTIVPNSNCIATTQFVKTQIDNLLGTNVSSALDTISEIK